MNEAHSLYFIHKIKFSAYQRIKLIPCEPCSADQDGFSTSHVSVKAIPAFVKSSHPKEVLPSFSSLSPRGKLDPSQECIRWANLHASKTITLKYCRRAYSKQCVTRARTMTFQDCTEREGKIHVVEGTGIHSVYSQKWGLMSMKRKPKRADRPKAGSLPSNETPDSEISSISFRPCSE